MRIGFRAKVLLAISGMTLMACTLISICFFNLSVSGVENSYIRSLRGMLSVSMRTFEDTVRTAYDTSVELACSAELQQMAADYLAHPGDSARAQDISAFLKQYQPDGGIIDSIYLYLPDRMQVITSVDYHAAQEIFYPDSYPWLVMAEENPAGTRLAPALLYDKVNRAPKYVLTYARPMPIAGRENSAQLAVNLNERVLFYQLLNQGTQTSIARYFLVDSGWRVVSAKNSAEIGLSLRDLLGEDAPALENHRVSSVEYGDGSLLAAVPSAMTGYHLVCVTDREEMVGDLRAQLSSILLILLGTTLVMLLLALFVSHWMYEPVKNLKDAMKKVREGDLSARALVWEHDEIGELSRGFNDTVAQVENLIGQLVDERMQKKEAELNALQYQITPHFMYNTLNSIKYAAVLQGADRIGEQLGAFIELLQASVSRHGAFVQVQDELRLVESYVKLQRFRYMDAFTVDYHIDPASRELYVPRLILQPLVENAILHGVKLKGGDCRIAVDAQLDGSQLILRVTDNGAGMTREQAAALTGGRAVRRKRGGFSGIGIPNIQERLRLYYGDAGRMHYSSAPGEGTRAVILLPASRDAAEYQI